MIQVLEGKWNRFANPQHHQTHVNRTRGVNILFGRYRTTFEIWSSCMHQGQMTKWKPRCIRCHRRDMMQGEPKGPLSPLLTLSLATPTCTVTLRTKSGAWCMAGMHSATKQNPHFLNLLWMSLLVCVDQHRVESSFIIAVCRQWTIVSSFTWEPTNFSLTHWKLVHVKSSERPGGCRVLKNVGTTFLGHVPIWKHYCQHYLQQMSDGGDVHARPSSPPILQNAISWPLLCTGHKVLVLINKH